MSQVKKPELAVQSHADNRHRVPKWSDYTGMNPKNIPPERQKAMINQGSMTDFMEEATGKSMTVTVITNGWGVSWEDEAKALGAASEEYSKESEIWVREVILSFEGVAWIYARSLFPALILAGKFDFVNLGDTPLGRVLFADEKTVRSSFEFAIINRQNALYNSVCVHLPAMPMELNARRSTFHLANDHCLLTEVFLPAFLAEE